MTRNDNKQGIAVIRTAIEVLPPASCLPLLPLEMEAPLTRAMLDSSYGCLFLGEILASILFGVTTLQAYLYFDNCTDGRTLKYSIGLLWIIDAVHLGCSIHSYYWYGVINFMDPSKLAFLPWSLTAVVCLTTASDVVTRSIYLHRIWTVSKKGRWAVSMIGVVSSLMILNIVLSIVLATHETTFAEVTQRKWAVCAIFASSAVADVIIAATLCQSLWRRRTKIRRTNGIIHVLMLYSINTAALTSSCNVLVLILYATMSQNFIFMPFYLAMPKLYTNSILAMLNARGKLRENNIELISIPLTRLEEGDRSSSRVPTTDKMNLGSGMVPTVQVQVDTVVTTDKDPSL